MRKYCEGIARTRIAACRLVCIQIGWRRDGGLRTGLLGLCVLRDTESRRGEAHDHDAENSYRDFDRNTPHVYVKRPLNPSTFAGPFRASLSPIQDCASSSSSSARLTAFSLPTSKADTISRWIVVTPGSSASRVTICSRSSEPTLGHA